MTNIFFDVKKDQTIFKTEEDIPLPAIGENIIFSGSKYQVVDCVIDYTENIIFYTCLEI